MQQQEQNIRRYMQITTEDVRQHMGNVWPSQWDSILKIFNFIIKQNMGNKQNFFINIWLIDYNIDQLNIAYMKQLVSSQFDKYKNYRVNIQDNEIMDIYKPSVHIKQNQQGIINLLTDAYRVQYEQRNIQDDESIFQYRIFMQIIQEFGQARQQELVNISRQEIDSVNKIPRQGGSEKNLISVQAACLYAGVSDMEFIKSSVIYWYIYQIIEQIRPQLMDFMNRNASWIIIYMASVLQFVDYKESLRRQVQQNVDFFEQNPLVNVSKFELRQMNRITPIRQYMDGALIQYRYVYQIRSPFQRFFQMNRIENNQGRIQGRQFDENDIQVEQALRDLQELYNSEYEYNYDNVISLQNGLKGRLYLILSEMLQQRIQQFRLQMIQKQNQFKYMSVIISVVFQVPINTQSNDDHLIDIRNYEIQQAQNNRIQERMRLQDMQIDNNQGYSRFYTITFNKNYYKFEDLDEPKEDIINFFTENIAEQVAILVNQYASGSLDNGRRQDGAVIAAGFQDAMVKQIRFRPISVFDLNYSYQQSQVDLQNLQQIQQINNQQFQINNNIFNNIVPQFRQSQRQVQSTKQESIYKYEQPPGKRRYGALFNESDYWMEYYFNDVDPQQSLKDCLMRTAQNLCKFVKYDLKFDVSTISLDHIFQIVKIIDGIFDRRVVITYNYGKICNKFQVSKFVSTVKDDQLILFIGHNHIFCATNKCDSWSKQQEQRMNNNLIFYKSNSAQEVSHKFIQCKQGLMTSFKILHNQHRACIYFDFETTFDDTQQRYINKGVKQRDQLQSFEQIEFAYSIVIDVKIKFKQIIQSIIEQIHGNIEYQIQSKDLIIFETDSYWNIGCANHLIQRILQIQQNINQHIHLYQQDLSFLIENYQHKYLKDSNEVEINNQIIAYSYNGAKFDNHFILSAIKDIHQQQGQQWYDYVSYIGDSADMKTMQYRDITFADIKLMTAGQSLKQFCKDMKLDQEYSKIDIDMQKMKTYSLALQNKDEIMKYVLYDSLAIYQIHKKFEKAVRNIVQDYSNTQIEKKSCLHFYQQKGIARKYEESNKQVYKNLRGYFKRWFTVSSLSVKIFKDFFTSYMIQAYNDEYSYQLTKSSYQGGYTQAFFIGDVDPLQGIYYLDYNSMYPSIMSKTKFPTNLSLIKHENCDKLIDRDNVREIGIYIDSDPLYIDNNDIYNLQQESGHYNLFTLSSFKFHDECFAPSFGIRTKAHGTIYPRQYDKIKDSSIKLIDNLVVFGFQISQAFRDGTLINIKVTQIMTFTDNVYCAPIFKQFDDYMYQARLNYKKQGNASMAQCVKIFINSLYGKFGEKHHEANIITSDESIKQNGQFLDIIKSKLEQIPNYAGKNMDDSDLIQQIKVKEYPLFDLNDRDQEAIRLNVSNIPMEHKHIGSFVYIASLITAIGRTLITRIINKLPINQCNVYYADTDSIILDRNAFNYIIDNKLELIDNIKLGALKNEYPIGSDIQQSQIQALSIYNKKIYQYMISDKWINKFKGCRDPSDDMREAFLNGQAKYTQKQNRFKKNNGNVTIIDFEMHYKLRLSRSIRDCGKHVKTHAYTSLSDLYKDYQDVDNHIKYNEESKIWTVTQ